MSVVHFYYFLQLKIIWAIKLKTKFIFFQVSIYLAITFRVLLFKFGWAMGFDVHQAELFSDRFL